MPKQTPAPGHEPLDLWRLRNKRITEISRITQDGPSLNNLTGIAVAGIPVTAHLAYTGFPPGSTYQALVAAAAVSILAVANNLRHARITRRHLRDTDLATLTAVGTYLREQPVAARSSRRIPEALRHPDLIAVYGGTRNG